MSAATLTLDDELAAILRGSNQSLQQTARELMLLELYRRGSISSGKAAELLDMGRWEFIRHAGRLGIPFFEMTEEEWEDELAAAEEL